MAKNAYQKTLREIDFDDYTAVREIACTLGEWNLIQQYTVPAQQQISIGGNELVGGGTQGLHAYIRLDDTSGQAVGAIRVVMCDANDANTQVLIEKSHLEWSASSTPDRTKSLLLPLSQIAVREDSKIKIEYKPDASNTIYEADADTDIQLPITIEQG